jgi:hypothetical protein
LRTCSTRVGRGAAEGAAPHRDRAGGGEDLPFVVVAVAHHQPVPAAVDLVSELLDRGGDLGCNAAASIFRAASRTISSINDRVAASSPASRGPAIAVVYREHGTYLPARRCRARLDQTC